MECKFSIKYRPKYAKNIIGLLEDGTVQSNHLMQYATNLIHRDAFEKISSNDDSVASHFAFINLNKEIWVQCSFNLAWKAAILIITSHKTLSTQPLHRGAFCKFPFRSIYYCHSSKSTGMETGKMHLGALCNTQESWSKYISYFH